MNAPWTMPFGKHAGKPLAHVPTGYIEWYLSSTEPIMDVFRDELDRRQGRVDELDAEYAAIVGKPPVGMSALPAGYSTYRVVHEAVGPASTEAPF